MSDPNMTPLIDLTFLLLITFIITFPMLEQGISIKLPRGKTDKIEQNKAQSITVALDGKVYLNGELLEEPYISVKTPAFGATDPITIEEGYIFVMGDNRTVSKDSRLLGPIPVSKVMGKAVFRLWPAFGGIYAE